jgi:hypothetical protein
VAVVVVIVALVDADVSPKIAVAAYLTHIHITKLKVYI